MEKKREKTSVSDQNIIMVIEYMVIEYMAITS